MARGYLNNILKSIKKYFLSAVAIAILIAATSSDIYSQELVHPTYHREFSLHVDNDAILIVPGFDKYYSSGIYFSYRRVLRPETTWFKFFNKKENLSKAIVSYTFEHRFYTSRNIKDNEVSKIDRPYAGWVDLAVGLSYHFKKNSVLKMKYDLGLLGPGTKAEELQTWFHGVFGMDTPRGWDYQINNTLATNFSMSYQKRLLVNPVNGIDITSESSMQMGTIRNNIRTGLALRMGVDLGSLDNSLFTQSKIGQERIKVKDIPLEERAQEIYLFYRIHQEFVIHNTTIDGNFVGAESSFTKVSAPWVLHQEFGIGRSGRLFDFLISYHRREREIAGVRHHKYVTMAITQRF